MKKQIYQWKDAAKRRIKTKPEIAAKALEAIRKKKGGKYSPVDVVTAAKAANHPLHKEFEWNDKKAAAEQRLERASYLVRSLEVVVSDTKDTTIKTVRIRKYQSLGTGSENGKESRYHDTQEVLSDAELRKQVMVKIWQQLLSLQRQYTDYTEFTAIWVAIDKTAETLAKLSG